MSVATTVDHPLGVQVERRVPAVMADGVTLYADVFRPRGDGPWPVLLMRQPYGRLIASTITYAHPAWYARRGFMVVIQDVRGRGDSEGAFYPFAAEAVDGLSSVAWAAALPGSNGRVGMYGFSYQGITQLLAAGAAPPALRAICPAMAAGDLPRTWFYLNGLLRLATAMGWGTQLARDGARHAGLVERQDELVAAMGAADRMTQTLPIESYPLLRRDDLGGHFFDWIAHPRPDAYWQRVGMADRWSQVATPALHIAGWYDQFLVGTIDNYRRLRHDAATPFRARPAAVDRWAVGALALDASGRGDGLRSGGRLANRRASGGLVRALAARRRSQHAPGPARCRAQRPRESFGWR